MELNIDPQWLREMAEKENHCITSVGGFFYGPQDAIPNPQPNDPTMITIQASLFDQSQIEHNYDDDDDQYYTPRIWIDRVEKALGRWIDLDPTAQPDKKHHFAEHNITEAMDCFGMDWFPTASRVERSTLFMNPPYSTPNPFLSRWLYYFKKYPITGITLTLPGLKNNKKSQLILKDAINAGILQAACDPFGRINFKAGKKKKKKKKGKDSNNRDSLFMFWDSTGDAANLTRFCEEFEQHGLISYFIPVS